MKFASDRYDAQGRVDDVLSAKRGPGSGIRDPGSGRNGTENLGKGLPNDSLRISAYRLVGVDYNGTLR